MVSQVNNVSFNDSQRDEDLPLRNVSTTKRDSNLTVSWYKCGQIRHKSPQCRSCHLQSRVNHYRTYEPYPKKHVYCGNSVSSSFVNYRTNRKKASYLFCLDSNSFKYLTLGIPKSCSSLPSLKSTSSSPE